MPKLFLETTVFNFYANAKEGKKRLDTVQLFDEITAGAYKPFTSEAVVHELEKSAKREEMAELIRKYDVSILRVNDEARRIAAIYVDEKVIPSKFWEDALHIATATVNAIDFVISFNMGHIVKPKSNVATGFINLDEGYQKVVLCTPSEVVDYDTRRTNRRTKGR